MDQPTPRRYVPAPPPTLRTDAQKRMHLRLELAKPSEFSKQTESTIVDLLRKTRTPFPAQVVPGNDHSKLVEAEAMALENTLRAFQKELVERERELREKELLLSEQETAMTRRAAELAQERALIEKQRQVFESGIKGGSSSAPLSDDRRKALEELQTKLDEQARTIDENKQWLREREAFLEESENTLFEKMQKQQERETELEQVKENLAKHEAKLNALAEKLRAKGEQI